MKPYETSVCQKHLPDRDDKNVILQYDISPKLTEL